MTSYLHEVARRAGQYRCIRSFSYRIASIAWPLFAPVTIKRKVDGVPINYQLDNPSDFELVINDIDIEQTTITRFLEALEHGDIVYDIGANIGTYGILAQNKLSECTVVLFEPLPENITRLKKNIKENDAAAEIHHTALSDSKGESEFIANNSKTGRIARNTTTGSSITVERTRGDVVAEQLSLAPTVMKIDVEGEELNVLKGFSETLSRGVRDIFVEIHEKDYSGFGLSKPEVNEIKRYLQQKGFDLKQIDETTATQTIHAFRE